MGNVRGPYAASDLLKPCRSLEDSRVEVPVPNSNPRSSQTPDEGTQVGQLPEVVPMETNGCSEVDANRSDGFPGILPLATTSEKSMGPGFQPSAKGTKPNI